jgi:hypothetical protein
MAEPGDRAVSLRSLQRADLFASARQLAEDRYLERWLAMYSGRGVFASWILLTGGCGHPSLWKFYKLIKKEGLKSYLRRYFSEEFYKELGRLGVDDKDIQSLLSARDTIAP